MNATPTYGAPTIMNTKTRSTDREIESAILKLSILLASRRDRQAMAQRMGR